jgi:hypothetical protein
MLLLLAMLLLLELQLLLHRLGQLRTQAAGCNDPQAAVVPLCYAGVPGN